jgi:hypothetical protein
MKPFSSLFSKEGHLNGRCIQTKSMVKEVVHAQITIWRVFIEIVLLLKNSKLCVKWPLVLLGFHREF